MGTNKRTQPHVTRLYSCFNEAALGVMSQVEVSISPGIPSFDVIGLCDSTIRESRGRIQSALISSGFHMPKGHITVSISPAYLHKTGSSFDLPIALGMLISSNQLPQLEGRMIYAEGELSLAGNILAVPGAAARLLSVVRDDREFDHIVIPGKESDAASVAGLEVYSLAHMSEVLLLAEGGIEPVRYSPVRIDSPYAEELDISNVKGQEKAMRALLIAACGYHSILLLGSPGCGKSTAANLIREIMPPLNAREVCEVYTVNDAARIVSDTEEALVLSNRRPLRRIYPGMSVGRVLGSGHKVYPGELALANHGIVFADEICEFSSSVIDCMRIPLDEHVVRLQKDGQDFIMPANFLFVGAGNPCRCGMYYEQGSKCICSPQNRKRYMNRISGPFADRIDLYTEMRSINGKNMYDSVKNSNQRLNDVYREIVKEVWDIQAERYSDKRFNGTIDTIDPDLMRASDEVLKYAAMISEKSGFSGRGYNRLIRVGRTIADINGKRDISRDDISEAAIYRYR